MLGLSDYTVSQETSDFVIVHIFTKYKLIFEILLLAYLLEILHLSDY